VTASALYEGTVRHRRFDVREHEFSYRLHMAYVDLDELPALLGGRLVASPPGVVRFRRSDYLGDPAVPLAESVRRLVGERLGSRPGGPIRMLANLRVLGHCFNPVAFYYCFDAAGERPVALVAEVTNTPWGERHAYVLGRDPDASGGAIEGRVAKHLHVSPFMGMDHVYEWRMADPDQRLAVHIASRRGDHVAFDATLAMTRRELTPRSLATLTLRQPAMSMRVLARIYRQALVLRLKGVRAHPHPHAQATP